MVPIRIPKPRHHLLTVAAALLLLLSTASCDSPRLKQFNPQKVNFTAQSLPFLANQLYPSLLLARSQADTSFTVSVTAPANNAVLRVVVDSSQLNYVTILQEILPARGQTYTFPVAVKWKYDQLRQIRQHRPLDLTFLCYINDEQIDIKNLHLDVRSINECPLSLRSPDGQIVDTRFLFAAYVNEEHPYIQQILTDILDQGLVAQFTGYQSSNKKSVTDQIFSVWYYALNRGISYSSISCTSNPSPRANVQHIRFFDEVYNTRQANCIDACVFFASILRKIGLKPVIFVEPCHAYLGYYTDKKQKTIATLETTITSWVNFPQLRKSLDADGRLPQEQLQKISKYLSDKQLDDYNAGKTSTDQLLMAVAASLFEKASQYNQENYQANQQHFDDPSAITYQKLDIETLRQHVQPIN